MSRNQQLGETHRSHEMAKKISIFSPYRPARPVCAFCPPFEVGGGYAAAPHRQLLFSGRWFMVRFICSIVFSACLVAWMGLAALADISCGRCGCVMHTSQPQSSCWNCGRPLGGPAPAPAPARPIYVESGRIDGFTPDGGINTSGITVFDSVNDPYRDSSRFNGTMQRVNRPLRDGNGRIVGWQEGWAWRNDVTGRMHFEGQNVTNNGLGGTNTQVQVRSGKRSAPVEP